jgi:predicted DNA-binding transcriptional regulator YafY
MSALTQQTQQTLQAAREAVHAKRKLQLDYRDLSGQLSQRVVRPLGCFFWGKVWTLAAWCESRQAFRSFRVDRIERVTVLEDRFRDEADKSLAQLLREVGATFAGN